MKNVQVVLVFQCERRHAKRKKADRGYRGRNKQNRNDSLRFVLRADRGHTPNQRCLHSQKSHHLPPLLTHVGHHPEHNGRRYAGAKVEDVGV